MQMNTSLTYRILKKLGFHYSEQEYGNITFFYAIKRFLKRFKNSLLLKYCMFSVLLSPWNFHILRPMMWRWMGAKVGKGVVIGYQVLIDSAHADLIELEEKAIVTNRCLLLCHQRDLSNYFEGDDSSKLPYRKGKITIKKYAMVGMDTIIMPGVTIGEGAVIGTGSLVTTDIPEWTVAAGRPAKVIRKIPKKAI